MSCGRQLNIVGAATGKPLVANLKIVFRNSEKNIIARTNIARRGIGADE
jgi:hypothetical protein